MAEAGVKISVVTSVKNGAPYFAEALRSVAEQSYENWEHLVIDAGSDDGSFELVQKTAANNERMRVVRREGEPLYQSLLWGLSEAKGDYLAWLNADDLYAPWAFQTVAEMAGKSGAHWITGQPACWDENGALKFVRPQGWHPQGWIQQGRFHLEGLGFLQQEAMFFSRVLFEKLSENEREKFASLTFAGDFYLWKTFAAHAPLTSMPTVLGGFRRHDGNMSSRNMGAYMDEVREIGGWFPPARIAAMWRRIYRIRAALKSLPLVRAQDEAMTELSAAPKKAT